MVDKKILDKVFDLLQTDMSNTYQSKNFLAAPLAISADGRQSIDFFLGYKSESFYAFIVGTARPGKSVFFKNIITEIAKKYTSIDEYNALNSNKPIPHTILVIDEVYKLFTGDYSQQKEINDILENIVKQGEGGAFGIHLILSTQAVGSSGINSAIMEHKLD